MEIFFLVIVFFIWLIWMINHISDRVKNPEKWKRKDFELDVDLYIVEHQMAFERIPKSRWIEMNRDQKADVYRAREKMKEKFFKLTQAKRDAIKAKYSFDDTFQGTD